MPHTFTFTHTLSLSLTHTHTHSLSLSHTHTHTISRSLYYVLSLSPLSPRFKLWLEARDQSSSPPLSSFQPVEVQVQDVNDNSPKFQQALFTANLTENSPRGTPVLKLQATDEDSGANAQLTYSITGGNQNNTFVIDPDTGLIETVNGVVDRERIPLYNLEVRL